MTTIFDADLTVEGHERVSADLDSQAGQYIIDLGNIRARIPEDKGDSLGEQLRSLAHHRDLDVAS